MRGKISGSASSLCSDRLAVWISCQSARAAAVDLPVSVWSDWYGSSRKTGSSCSWNTRPTSEDSALNDAQIAHIAVTASNIDIAYAHLALAISANPCIRRFAEKMIADHSAVNAKAGALAKKLSLTPQDNDVSTKLLADAKNIKDSLSQKRGQDFGNHSKANAAVFSSVELVDWMLGFSRGE